MSLLDADHCSPSLQVEERHWLLRQLEDWLLRASDEVSWPSSATSSAATARTWLE